MEQMNSVTIVDNLLDSIRIVGSLLLYCFGRDTCAATGIMSNYYASVS